MKNLLFIILLFLLTSAFAQCKINTEVDKFGIDSTYNWTSHKITRFGEAATFKFIWFKGDSMPKLEYVYFIAYSAVITIGNGDALNIVFEDKSILSLPITNISQGTINHDYYSHTSNTVLTKIFSLNSEQLNIIRTKSIKGFRLDGISYRMQCECNERQSRKIKEAAMYINKP